MFSEFLEIGVPQSKIEYVPNSVNTQLFFPINKTYENKVLFVGRLNFNKGLHVLLKSLNYITVNLELTVVGPSDSNLTYFKELMNEITRQNVLGKHRINYVGPKNQEELIRLYQDASIFVLPSFREASPMSILEAMACGTPVVATPVGGIPEMVNDNTTGLIIPTGDPVKLGHAIETLLNNPELRIKFGKNARKRVMTLFSDEKIMEKYRTIYESILKN
jgi:glycosyltransferase involved in cell wall biosynthesis